MGEGHRKFNGLLGLTFDMTKIGFSLSCSAIVWLGSGTARMPSQKSRQTGADI